MNRLILIVALALTLGGCAGKMPAWLISAEQKAADLYAKIKVAAPLVEGEIDNAVAAVCGEMPAINDAVKAIEAAFPTAGPKTQAAVAVADRSLAIVGASCTAWAASPATAGNVSFFLRLYTAYTSGKRAVTAAQAAGGA